MRIQRWLWGSAFALILFLSLPLGSSRWMPIRAVEVSGVFPPSMKPWVEDSVRPLLRLGFLGLHLHSVQATLMEHFPLREVKLRRIWPDRIVIELYEHTPCLRWNKHAALSCSGVLFYPLKGDERLAQLPSLRGPSGTHGRLWSFWRRFEDPLKIRRLSMRVLRMDTRGGFEVLLNQGTLLQLGRETPEFKMDRFIQAYDILWKRASLPARIDLRYPKGFAVREHRASGQQMTSES